MVNGTYVFTHPPFVLDVAISRIVRQPKEMLHFTAHTYIHMYATLLNDELMNKTIKKIEHKHLTPRVNRFNYIKYYGLLSCCTKQ